jgi:glyoxylase-like metal-dependent hydrolase (beta-lactamase superfamily II)
MDARGGCRRTLGQDRRLLRGDRGRAILAYRPARAGRRRGGGTVLARSRRRRPAPRSAGDPADDLWHTRSTPAILGRYPGSSVWVHETIADRFAERTPFTDTFRAGDKLPGGILAFETTRASREVVLWLPSHRALVVGDVLLGAGDGGARLCPPSWLHGTTADAVRTALRPVLDLPVELLLLTHGDAIESDARGALERALAE